MLQHGLLPAKAAATMSLFTSGFSSPKSGGSIGAPLSPSSPALSGNSIGSGAYGPATSPAEYASPNPGSPAHVGTPNVSHPRFTTFPKHALRAPQSCDLTEAASTNSNALWRLIPCCIYSSRTWRSKCEAAQIASILTLSDSQSVAVAPTANPQSL